MKFTYCYNVKNHEYEVFENNVIFCCIHETDWDLFKKLFKAELKEMKK